MQIRERGGKKDDISRIYPRKNSPDEPKNCILANQRTPDDLAQKYDLQNFGQHFINPSEIIFLGLQKLPKHSRNDPEQLWKNCFSQIFVDFHLEKGLFSSLKMFPQMKFSFRSPRVIRGVWRGRSPPPQERLLPIFHRYNRYIIGI